VNTAWIVVDLGFGDAGKGSVVDALAHYHDADAIVRYTGGPHAAHHLVREDGTSHAFCQFGATFKTGVRSHLARNVLVKPENLLYEGEALQQKGCDRPFARLSINPACRVITSYHAMLCQMKEVARGAQRFGSVGIGAGEAVLDAEEHPELTVWVSDLNDRSSLHSRMGMHYEHKLRQAQALLRDHAGSPIYGELRAVYDSFMSQVRLKHVLERYQQFASLPVSLRSDAEFLAQCSGEVIFEGAHAALLDHEHGYYPYVAKTDTTTGEALRILEQPASQLKPYTIGVMRALGYRHGPGPFVTEDARLAQVFQERHNKGNDWQGQVRYGWFDLLAMRHGLRLNRQVDALALTMLDHLEQLDTFQVCLSYRYRGQTPERLAEYFETASMPGGWTRITGIKPVPTRRCDRLARLLFDCVPDEWLRFDRKSGRAEDFIRFLESSAGLGKPVQLVSNGPLLADRQERWGMPGQ
jgi:adenylosuccinate synthase